MQCDDIMTCYIYIRGARGADEVGRATAATLGTLVDGVLRGAPGPGAAVVRAVRSSAACDKPYTD